MEYHEPVFRPPAEANSVILQVTLGCKWNQCHFCEMYSSKIFQIKSIQSVKEDLNYLNVHFPSCKRLFIGDGDVFSIGFENLVNLLQLIRCTMPQINRISAYASARELIKFNKDELIAIRQSGLTLLYIGIESGDNETLKLINKGISSEQQLEAALIAKEAGFKLSVMILNGLGGQQLSHQHAIQSANFINQLQPELLSFLTVSYPFGFEHFQQKLKTPFKPLTQLELAQETRLIISNLNLDQTIFRSDHISNLMPLKGGLNRDKDRILSELDQLITYLKNNNQSFINESRHL